MRSGALLAVSATAQRLTLLRVAPLHQEVEQCTVEVLRQRQLRPPAPSAAADVHPVRHD